MDRAPVVAKQALLVRLDVVYARPGGACVCVLSVPVSVTVDIHLSGIWWRRESKDDEEAKTRLGRCNDTE